jgi:hypothetical protein
MVPGEAQPRVLIFVASTGGVVGWGDGVAAIDVALSRDAAKQISLNDNAGGSAILNLGPLGRLTLPRNLTAESVAGRARWSTETDAATGARLLVYDSQRERDMASRGWAPYALAMGYTPADALATAIVLPISGGSIAIPIFVPGHMLAQDIWFQATAASGTGEFRLYVERLNNGNAGENTLDEVPGSAGTIAALGAAGSAANNLTASPLYLGPGVYWLVIRCTSGATAINFGSLAIPASTPAVAHAKTKTLGGALGSTLDFVAATWVTKTGIPGAIIRGRVFGQGTAWT